MAKLKKRTTNIAEEARRELGITRDQYAFVAYVAYRCADPRNKQAGWCTDRIEEIAEFVGISRQGLYKMATAMAEFDLIDIDNHWHFRPTAKWIDVESGCKQSLQNGDTKFVNKVDKGRKQSLQELREKRKQSLQTPIIELDIKEKEREGEEKTPPPPASYDEMMERVNAETLDVEAKKEKTDSPGAPRELTASEMEEIIGGLTPTEKSELFSARAKDILEAKKEKNKSPFISPAPPNYEPGDFDIYSKVPLTDMLEDDPGLLVNGFDASTLPGAMIRTAEIMPTNGTQITIKTGMNEAGETYVFEHTERVTNPTPAARILNGVNRAPLAEDSDGAQKLIMAWATNGALETVQNWYNLARRKFTPEDLELMTAKFCGTYSTIADAGRRSLFFSDPVQFFRNKGRVFIQDQKSFERMNEPKNGFLQPETKSNLPKSIRHF